MPTNKIGFAHLLSGALLAVALSPASRAMAGNGNSVSLASLAGGYASTVQGSIALCLDSATFAEVPCDSASLVVPLTDISVGNVTYDTKGNSCGAYVQVVSNLPPAASPPNVVSFTTQGKVTTFDQAAGAIDATFTTYVGGKCNGSVFDGTGATIQSTGTGHGVLSAKGTRTDGIFTSLTDPVGGVGGWSFVYVDLKQ